VALTAVTGGLRQFALQRGHQPRQLKTMVPVSMRAPAEATALGNRISFVFVDLPLHLRNPRQRIEAVRVASATFKRGGQAAGGEAVLGLLGFMPGPLRARAARLAAAPRTYNLVVSNVPGPRVPVYLLGARLREAFPVVPLSDGHALSIGMFSYGDRMNFGLYADPAALPGIEDLPLALNAAVLELARSRPVARAA
jgi:WS/DGAT/MGAT family acyltransferase